ncbi:hypothetical protein [Flammeovirga sp. OC4]|uniref:hypothetical protein n=1 Tax=Flammeovirga sp. OC4 TaxID=1382345 RepID=UPI0012E038D8|nr:hypothetical protein [Flammeovirga sp. OC4]
MKNKIRKWGIRTLLFILLGFVSITITMLNPNLLYARKTQIGNYTIYHEKELHQRFEQRLKAIDSILVDSELYDSKLELKVCLGNDALYPQFMKTIWGNAFGWGMYNIATLNGAIDIQQNIIELHGYQWNFEQLLLHELTHCLQFNAFGFWNSNPLAKHPEWKWEGYAEYVARQGKGQHSLLKNMERIESARMVAPDEWGVFFEDKTVAPRVYYDYWLMVQYCMEVKKMSYKELLKVNLKEDEVKEEIMVWYELKSIR